MSNKNRKKWKADLIIWLNKNVLSDNPETLGCFKKNIILWKSFQSN